MWIEILNRSFEDYIVVKENKPLGFLVIEPENVKFHYAQAMKKKIKQKKGELLDMGEKDNLVVSLVDMISHTRVETLLIRQVKSHQE